MELKRGLRQEMPWSRNALCYREEGSRQPVQMEYPTQENRKVIIGGMCEHWAFIDTVLVPTCGYRNDKGERAC